jgi:chromosomal replication initiator protein
MLPTPPTKNQLVRQMTQKFPFDQFLKWEEENTTLLKAPLSQNKPAAEQQPPKVDGGFEELKLLGHEIKEALKNYITSAQFSSYFSDTFQVTNFDSQNIEFTVTTAFIKRVIETQFLDDLKKSILDVLGRPYEISFKTFQAKTQSLSSNNESILKELKKPSNAKDNTFIISDLTTTKSDADYIVASKTLDHFDNSNKSNKIDSNKSFQNFVVGPSNNLANASAMAVARDPGMVYPSLYIYGNSGLGKTHLIHAIANYIIQHRPHLKIRFTSCTNMMNEYVESTLKNKRLDFYREYTQSVDILIIDDIHDLSGKTQTQEQFFHIFNDLSNQKKQLIFTSDKTPKEIAGIEERIRTRLSSSLSVEIQQPDLETRIAILKTKAQEKDFFVSDEILALIAKCVKTSVRELEGNLIQLKAYYDLTNVDIDLELAREYLKLDEHIESNKLISVDSITKTVAHYYKIPLGDIRGKSKTKDIVLARQVAMYLIHQHLRKTLTEIAHFFGKKDHTTPMYNIDLVKKKLKSDQTFAQQLLEIEKML